MNFERRVWTARFEEGDSVLSQLAVDVHAALIAARIEIAFQRRDIHIRNGERDGPALLTLETDGRSSS